MLTNGAAEDEPATVRHVVDFMPRIRSTLTKGDSDEAWREAVLGQMVLAIKAIESLKDAAISSISPTKHMMGSFRQTRASP